MTAQAADELLRQFCHDLQTLWRQAGGPSLRHLSGRVGLSKSQIGAILSGQIRRPPDWDAVRALVSAFHQYARDHGRAQHVSLRAGVEELWRPRHTVLESAFGLLRRTTDPKARADGLPPPRPVPRQLPPAVRCFTGRAAQLRELTSLLVQLAEGAGTVVISSINGMAGVGKTALAVHWAHRVADHFPDGQLYVNLRGYHAERPMGAGEALTGFLSAIGVPDHEVPPHTDGRSARYRSELAGRRMLVVLDNASSVEQVRPLLPGTGRCLVLVTSRDKLAGLVAVDGAQRLNLTELPLSDASTLLHRLIGRRAETEPDALTVLAQRCAQLPLALRLAAELASRRTEAPLADLVAELADGQRRLDLLAADGDPHAAVTAVFSWSIQHLPADAARAFRLLGLHPGPDTDAYAVAALTGTDLVTARRILELLARAHLVLPTTVGRYAMHDLLRAYALNLTTAQDNDTDHRAALDRLFDYYLAAAASAIDHLFPETRQELRITPAATPAPDLTDLHTARRWLDTERPTLAAVASYTATHGWPSHTIRLSIALSPYLDGGHYADALAIHNHAHDAARKSDDSNGQAHALRALGNSEQRLGRYMPAADHYRQALALFRQSGDPDGEARTLQSLGFLQFELGRYESATGHFREALVLFRQAGNRISEALTLNHLGAVERRRGRYDSAADHYAQALTLARQAGAWTGEAIALDGLGLVEQQLGLYREAADHHEHALTLARRLGNRRGEAHVLDNLGAVHIHLGHSDHARIYLEQALSLFTELGDRWGQATALNSLGEAALAAGNPPAALPHFTAALTVAAAIGAPYEQARAHTGLGHAHRACGDTIRARRHYENALTHSPNLASVDSDRIRAHLAAVAEPGTE